MSKLLWGMKSPSLILVLGLCVLIVTLKVMGLIGVAPKSIELADDIIKPEAEERTTRE